LKNWFIPTDKNKQKPYFLRNSALIIYTAILFVFNTFSGVLGMPLVYSSSITPQNIISISNEERVKYGLGKLSTSIELTTAAQAKAQNMFNEQYWDHFGPKGETPWQFIKASGYVYVYAGENLAKGFKSSEGVVQAWMASPSHRENLLSGNYKDIGVAAVAGELLGENVILVVQMFGNRTNQVVESVTDLPPEEESPSQKESGEIKSIKITYPEDGLLTSDKTLNIKGLTENIEGNYEVNILDNDKRIESKEFDGNQWEYDKKSDWSEGKHEVEASVSIGNEKVADSVGFTIDTTPPEIIEETLSVSKKDDVWEFIFETKESTKVEVRNDEKIVDIEKVEGRYQGRISNEDVGKKVVILASDDLGNISELEISGYFVEKSTTQSVSGIPLINSIDIKKTVNILFVLFIFTLLITQISVYIKRGVLVEKANNLYTVGIWWVLLAIGSFSGFSGSIF